MAALMKIGKLSKISLIKNTPFVRIINRSYEEIKGPQTFQEFMLKDLNPEIRKLLVGRYPKTEEERLKAAAKYDLHPDEYKPYPDDHNGSGDYPDLPYIGADAKDPYYPWDYGITKTNYGEALPLEADLLGGDRCSYGIRKRISDGTASIYFVGGLAFALLLGYLSPTVPQPMMDKQYPSGGTHYTFEIVK
ncbi:NADH dehydrogenase [ubiquinone] 1 beta subcomplex subunit 8, mitochondrial [Anthophora plagiata]